MTIAYVERSSMAARGVERAGFCVKDAREIASLLRDASGDRVVCAWSLADGGGSGVGSLAAVERSVRLLSDTGVRLSGRASLSFSLHGVPMRLECRLDGGCIVEAQRIAIVERRSATRVAPDEVLHMQWYSVGPQGVQINRAPLIDFGVDGGRTLHLAGSPTPEPGPFAASILAHGAALHCMAEVRSRAYTARGLELGLSFAPEDPMAFADIVLRTLFPEVTLRRQVPVAELERLFQASGYHRLRDGALPTEQWAALDADAISRDLVYVARDGAAVAHGSMTRAYRHTWLGHQMAMRSDHPEAARARRVQTAMIMVTSLLGGRQARSMAYYDATKAYGRVFFDRFAESVDDPALATLANFDWIDWESETTAPLCEAPAHVTAGAANAQELAAVADLVRRQLPTLQADAMDVRPGLLRSTALHSGYPSSGLSRGREVFVVRLHERIVGAALCEYTSAHLNLLNELNLAQFFFLPGASEPGAKRALQQVVRRFYAERGIAKPFVIAPTDSYDVASDPGARVAMRIRCITWSFEGIRAYENYLKLRCASIERRRRSGASHKPALIRSEEEA